jgi:hypothetical protein
MKFSTMRDISESYLSEITLGDIIAPLGEDNQLF